MENHNTQIETSIFWEKRPFEATSLIAFSANACDFENILDVGANTGIYTLVAGSANKNANIIAIEPIVSIFNLLEKNVKKNKFNATCLNIAATNVNKLVTIWDFDTEISSSASLKKGFRDNTKAVQVQGMRLENILINNNFSNRLLIKIDVESHEPQVLIGMKNIIDDPKSELIILIEILSDENAVEVESILINKNFKYFMVYDDLNKVVCCTELKAFSGLNYFIVSNKCIDDFKYRLTYKNIKIY